MKKLLIFPISLLLLSSCFGGEEVTVEIPKIENTIKEQTLDPVETLIVDDTETIIENTKEEEVVAEIEEIELVESTEKTKLTENTEEVIGSPASEPVPIEKVEIKDSAADNTEYDVRANIETDPEASVVTEETFVVPTAPVVQEVKIDDIETLPEDEALADDILSELLEGIVDWYDVIEENE